MTHSHQSKDLELYNILEEESTMAKTWKPEVHSGT